MLNIASVLSVAPLDTTKGVANQLRLPPKTKTYDKKTKE